ncbi:MAG TPA: arginase family protein [Candidatus Limnocylindrales bacterium]|nr:arginase family protein [Candidatus Limnocylindrales bacterium]
MTDLPDFAAIAAAARVADHADDPLPGWAGLATLFGASPASVGGEAPPPEAWVAAGVPFDATSSSRPGAAEGPRAVRAASVIYASGLKSWRATEMVDMRTLDRFAYAAPVLIDTGDFPVYPTDLLRTFASVSGHARTLLESARRAIFLQGDHSVTFPTFAGYRAARPGRRLGFVNVDHHFDFGNWSAIHGALYHGSNSRRISELPGMRPRDIAFVGVGDVTRAEQYEWLLSKGFHVVRAADIRREGAARALASAVAHLAEECDGVYVSLDIDVLDASVAPGTGNVTMGGLAAGELLDVFEQLRELPIEVLDVAEVSPRHDPTGRTAQIAARVLFEFLFREPTKKVP